MKDIWEEREKALENQYFKKLEREQIHHLKEVDEDRLVKHYCHNRCPKCGEPIVAMSFRGVPLDKCPGCGGVWLGPEDLSVLAEKDHRTWFQKWFQAEEKE